MDHVACMLALSHYANARREALAAPTKDRRMRSAEKMRQASSALPRWACDTRAQMLCDSAEVLEKLGLRSTSRD